jgi:pimeloyl-ACP methyl ester carboxylesterase
MTHNIDAPSLTGLLGEVAGLMEFPKLLLQLPALARQPRGRGERVLVLPGFGAGDASTSVIRVYLASLGYRPLGWGLGLNNGDVPELLEQFIHRLEATAQEEGEPIRLIGWSLGGYLAREAARERPIAVHQVITLGSPVIGGPKYTALAAAFRTRGIDLDAVEAEVEARNSQALETPVTAVYSKSDAVVAWRACLDHHAPNVEHVEVQTTHLGLGFSPEVLQVIANRLARRLSH